MKISRELAIQILKYCYRHRSFYFPFSVVCKEYPLEGDNFLEIEPSEWRTILENKKFKTFELWENLQDLRKNTVESMSKGYIEEITNNSFEKHLEQLAINYRKEWNEKLCESESIEEYGLNEFIGGKADAYEDCLVLIKKYQKFGSTYSEEI